MPELYNTQCGPVLIIGNGPSLADIPDEFLRKYPSFGCNAIHLRRGFTPTYWACADDWVLRSCDLQSMSADMPKFVLDILDAEDCPNLYRWHRKQAAVWLDPKDLRPNTPMDPGFAFKGITHAMLQLAYWMGYERFYLVGCDNTGTGEHFYSEQLNDYAVDVDLWEWAFDTLQVSFIPKPIINLSTRGRILCLPMADWKKL